MSAAGDEAVEVLSALKKLHLLPLAEADARRPDAAVSELPGADRLTHIAPALRRLRCAQQVLKSGDLVSNEHLDFVVVKCEPAQGVLSTETEYFLEGSAILSFTKIQFSGWGPVGMSSDTLFSECIAKHISGDYASYGTKGAKCVRLFFSGMTFQIGDVCLQVEAVEPIGLGVVSGATDIFAQWDDTPEFSKVHIVPFQDTLPRAYTFDVFQDYVRPYLQALPHKRFHCNELFNYHGVQCKLVACEPSEASARIGKSTQIYCEGTLPPSMRHLLTPDQLTQVSQLPLGLQMLLLNTERTTREVEDVLSQRRGLVDETIAEVEAFLWPPSDAAIRQTTCMVCLAEFEVTQECRKLPCCHVFHKGCVDEWLRRCTDCPICKANVDRAIRRY